MHRTRVRVVEDALELASRVGDEARGRHTVERLASEVVFYGDDWRRSHERDKRFHWMRDRDDDRGYYSHGEWHALER